VDNNVVLTTLAVSGTWVAFLNWLKKSPWFPWITKEKVTLLRGLSALSALAGGVGIHWVWTATDHSFAVSGLTPANLLALGAAIYKQFVANELIYQVTKRTSDPQVVKVAQEVEQVLPPEMKTTGPVIVGK
jgi:hypothetical protein